MHALPSWDSLNSARCGQRPGFYEVWPARVQLVVEAVVNPVCPGYGTGQLFT